MRELRLWEAYDRREVHDIFSPNTTFVPQAGTWGLQGIVRVPDHLGDYVFFVTFGQSQGAHVFEESVTEDGVLTWQSQPRQSLTDPIIRRLVSLDERLNTVHLFLRTRRAGPYTYLGPLGYLEHDNTREQPVYFQWQILEGPIPVAVTGALGLTLVPSTERTATAVVTHGLTEAAAPKAGSGRRGRATPVFGSKKQARYPGQDAKNAALGLAGENLVFKHEIEQLRRACLYELADAVVHVSQVEGDSAGYDIRSFTDQGDVRHIEVKTTRGTAATAFFASAREVEFSRQNPDTYVLHRLYEYDDARDAAQFYVVDGPLADGFVLEANEYRVFVKPELSDPDM